jgi:FHA domain
VQPDYLLRGRELGRADFVRNYPFPFLVGASRALVQPAGPQRTGVVARIEDFDNTLEGDEPDDRPVGATMVLAVRKIQPTFGKMITVGRTSNNDLVIRDVTVSKFHAFFRSGGAGMEIGDAGSRNGTWVGRQKLPPKGPTSAVPFGADVRFGSLVFQLVDAGGCWDFLHQRKR